MRKRFGPVALWGSRRQASGSAARRWDTRRKPRLDPTTARLRHRRRQRRSPRVDKRERDQSRSPAARPSPTPTPIRGVVQFADARADDDRSQTRHGVIGARAIEHPRRSTRDPRGGGREVSPRRHLHHLVWSPCRRARSHDARIARSSTRARPASMTRRRRVRSAPTSCARCVDVVCTARARRARGRRGPRAPRARRARRIHAPRDEVDARCAKRYGIIAIDQRNRRCTPVFYRHAPAHARRVRRCVSRTCCVRMRDAPQEKVAVSLLFL